MGARAYKNKKTTKRSQIVPAEWCVERACCEALTDFINLESLMLTNPKRIHFDARFHGRFSEPRRGRQGTAMSADSEVFYCEFSEFPRKSWGNTVSGKTLW